MTQCCWQLELVRHILGAMQPSYVCINIFACTGQQLVSDGCFTGLDRVLSAHTKVGLHRAGNNAQRRAVHDSHGAVRV